jgi:shikimate dehydrogenase
MVLELEPTATLCFSFAARPSRFGFTLFNAAFRAEGLDWLYKPVQVTTSAQLKDAVAGLRGLNARGCGVSMPWKAEIMLLLDQVDDAARAIGAVNTVVNEGGKLWGHNTDAWGAERVLKDAGVGRGTRVLLLGSGGVAAALAWALNALGAKTTVAARRPADLAQRFGLTAVSWENRESVEAQVVVNATPIGMAPETDATPIARRFELVADLVASPPTTRLIREALGRTVTGPQFTLEQAVRQFELYTGRPAPRPVMLKALASLTG